MKKSNFYISLFSLSLITVFLMSCDGGMDMAKMKEMKAKSMKKQVVTIDQQILHIKSQLKENPNDANLWKILGNIYFDTDNPTEAIKAYNQSLFLDDKNPNVWTDLGVMYRRVGKPIEAIKCFDNAVNIDPDHTQATFNKGVVYYYDMKDFKMAKKAWQSLLLNNPNAIAPNGTPVSQLISALEAEESKKIK